MNKTIKQWLNTLPEPYREQALKNWENEGLIESKYVTTTNQALKHAFTWAQSNEGFDYWRDFYYQLQGKE